MCYSKIFSYESPDNKTVAVLEISCSRKETTELPEFSYLGKDLVWQLGKDVNEASLSMDVFINIFMKEEWHLEDSKTVSDVLQEKSKLLSDDIKIKKAVKFTVK